jgi:hypothetical protein
MNRWPRLAAAALLGSAPALGALVSGEGSSWASVAPVRSVDVNYTAAAMAPVLQATEDEPTAQFHPEGEGDFGYSMVTASPSGDSALASVMWPGAAAGNAGTLAVILGGPSSLTALNDPVQASASSGTGNTSQSTTTPAGTRMDASVQPSGPNDQHASADSVLAGGGLGSAGTIGSSSSATTIDFDSSTGALDVTATSSAHDLSVDGIVRIGSFRSSASAVSTAGATPRLTGATAFTDMTIAGQSVYVDGTGPHVGSPGQPAGPAEIDAVDAALSSAGMEVYFSAPHTIAVGGVAYYYAASVVFFWAPPGDAQHNSFTLTLGGAAVSVTDSASSFSTGLSFGGGPVTGSGTTPAQTSAAVATAPSTAGPSSPSLAGVPSVAGATGSSGGATLALPASPSAGVASAAPGGAEPAAASLPGGVGAGWFVLAAVAALAGAALTTRVPRLLTRQAAAACPNASRTASSSGRTANHRRISR